MEIGDKKNLHGNVRISDLVEIWLRSGLNWLLNLILNAVRM